MSERLIHGIPARHWRGRKPRIERLTPKEQIAEIEHRCAAIRVLADKLADQLSDDIIGISARQVLDALERFWPQDCKVELAKGRD